MGKGVPQTVFLLLRTACHLLCLDSTLQRMSSQTQEMRFVQELWANLSIHQVEYISANVYTCVVFVLCESKLV